jgi:intracellular sulfur oxidation DsrE/DsrF family protein
MKKKLLLTLTAFILASVVALSQTPAAPKHKTIIQLNEAQGSEWNVLPLHVQNLQAALAKDGGVQVEVIFFGQGLNMLRKTNAAYEERLKKLKDSGVTLAACQNAMKLMNIKSEDLFPFATEVDSAMAELTRRQEQGYAYIH